MKCFSLAILASAAVLCGCASTNDSSNLQTPKAESYTPLGTIIARKNPSRMDNNTIIDQRALENDRTMGNGTSNGPGTR